MLLVSIYEDRAYFARPTSYPVSSVTHPWQSAGLARTFRHRWTLSILPSIYAVTFGGYLSPRHIYIYSRTRENFRRFAIFAPIIADADWTCAHGRTSTTAPMASNRNDDSPLSRAFFLVARLWKIRESNNCDERRAMFSFAGGQNARGRSDIYIGGDESNAEGGTKRGGGEEGDGEKGIRAGITLGDCGIVNPCRVARAPLISFPDYFTRTLHLSLSLSPSLSLHLSCSLYRRLLFPLLVHCLSLFSRSF